ncbi:MAG: hypothetical protein CR967_05590 [Proteobacteria bacterium]|nr:MAG: hypothetical protein CR967_05590 [Pseudomonadota bacterium]
MRKFHFIILFFALVSSLVYAKGEVSFGNNMQIGESSFSIDVKNLNISHDKIGQISNQKLIICNHDLDGFVEYTSKKKLSFYAKEPLRKGLKYVCKLSQNPKSKIYFFAGNFGVKKLDFELPNVARVVFNDSISREEFLKNVKLEKINKLSKTPLSYTIENTNGKVFALRLNENASKIGFNISKNAKSIHKASLKSDYKKVIDRSSPEFKSSKNAKEFVFYDEPSWANSKNGKIVLRVFTKEFFYANDNIRKFIKIKGMDNFSLSDCDWVEYGDQKKYGLNDKSWYYFDIIGDFLPNKHYNISFLKGFGNWNARLGEEKSFRIKTGDFGSYVDFENKDKPYISSFGEIAIKSVNVNEINIVIDKMLNQNLRYFMNFDKDISLNRVSKRIVSKKFTIGGNKNEYIDHKISLKEALEGLKKGVYEISILYGKNKHVSKKVYLSDLGLGAKVYKDGIFVWSFGLKDTRIIEDAKVEVFSSSNMPIANGYTNKFGVFEFKQKDFLSKKPRSILITHEDEQNFLILDNAIGRVDLGNISEDEKIHNAYVYFQSELIRPDEDLSALVIFKDKDYKSLKNAPVSVKIRNPINKIIYKKSFKTNQKGAFSLKVPLKNQKTGRYSFEVFYANKTRAVKNFFIEAFLPQKIKNELILSDKHVKTNALMRVGAKSNYLFGSPASFLKGSFRLRALGKDYENSMYKNFTFNNELLKKKNSIVYIDKVKNFTLDKAGNAEALLQTSINKTPPSILDAQLELSVLDDGRKVSTYKSFNIYPYDRMVGLYMQNTIYDTNTPVKVKTLLINPLNGEKENALLDVYVKKKKWYYSYDVKGNFKWNEEVVDLEHLTIKSGENIEKLFSKSGNYIMVVKDSLSNHSASASFSVRGWDYASLSPTDEIGKNEVNYEDKLYKKGDVVKLDIKSPIKKGKMLVSLEGERVYWYKVFDFENASLSVDVPLDLSLDAGLYIHTIALRQTDTPSNIIPFRASSSSFIKSDRTKHKLRPVIESEDVVKSNSTTSIKVKAKANSQVLVSVVDDGILQILGQKPPKVFDFFNKKPKSLVANYDIYDLILNYKASGKKLSFGSGAAALAKSKKHLSPQSGAKRVKPFVYFSKLLDVDESGELSVDLKTPNSYNGSATIVAIEIGKDTIGSSSKKLIVKDDIIIKPIMPRFGNVGDSWEIPVRIFNTSKKDLKVKLNASSNKLLEVEDFDKNLDLGANSSKLINVKINVKSKGKGFVSLDASTSGDKFSHKVELPLIYPYPLSTYNEQGETKDGLLLEAPEEYMQGDTPRYALSVSGDVLSRLRGGVDYLINYPYGCSEQVSSKLLALLHIKAFLNSTNKDEQKAQLKDREKFIASGIEKLASMQKSSGEFGYWKEDGYVNIYASIYASDVLLSLKKAGFNVPNFVIDGVKKSLKKYSGLKDEVNYFNKLYATYLLATQNIMDISNINYIYDNKIYQNNLPSIYMMAYILKKARMDSEMGAVLKLIKKYDLSKLGHKTHDNYFYSYARDLAFSLYLHVKHFSKDETSNELFRKLKKEFEKLYSTQDKAFALRALNEYFKDYKKDESKFSITTQKIDEIYDYWANLEGKYIQNEVTLIPQNKNWINYNFSVYQYLPKPVKHDNISKSKKTLSIYREFLSEKGEKLDLKNLKLGQTIYSLVALKAKEDINNVVVNEQIPSCFEIINERLSKRKRPDYIKNTKNFKADFVDIRDDRILTFTSLKKDQIVGFGTPMQVTTKGKCLLPPILTEAMYDERISDYDLKVTQTEVK